MPSPRRRKTLQLIGAALGTGLAGCAEGLTAGDDTDATPDEATATSTQEPLSLPSVVTRGDLPDGQVQLLQPGKVSFLNFFTTWCRPCQREMPDFRKLRAEFDQDQLHLVSITPEVDEQLIKQFWREYEGTWPVVSDGSLQATERWDATGYPTNLVFDPDGNPAGNNGARIRAREFEGFKQIVESALEG